MHTLHLPWLAQGDITHGQPAPIEAASDPRATFVRLWQAHPEQQRRDMREDARLTAAALAHARDLWQRDHDGTLSGTMHRDSQGRMSNERIRAHGYPLPAEWPDDMNYCEAICVTHLGPEQAAGILDGSSGHHDHFVGAGFFQTQTVWGMAWVYPAWWVLVTAPPEGDDDTARYP